MFQKGHSLYSKRGCFEKRQHPSPKTEFKKGRTPWNKGKKYYYLSGENASNWKGGKQITPSGYIKIRLPAYALHPNSRNGYIYEHRLVMEKHLGRYLTKDEAIHHKNGIKDDNRLENLELVSRFHGNKHITKCPKCDYEFVY